MGLGFSGLGWERERGWDWGCRREGEAITRMVVSSVERWGPLRSDQALVPRMWDLEWEIDLESCCDDQREGFEWLWPWGFRVKAWVLGLRTKR